MSHVPSPLSRPRPALARACALAALLGASPARAQSASDAAAAQALFDEAKTLLAKGQAAEACPKLEESQRLDPGSGTLVNLARCYEEVGRTASAWSKYLEAASAARAAGNPEREGVARERAAALEPTLSRLVVVVPEVARVEGLTVTRDGDPVGKAQWGLAIPSDPGERTVAASAPGFVSWSETVTVVGSGGRAEVTVPVLARGAEPPGARDTGKTPGDGRRDGGGWGTQHTLSVVAAGVGLAGVAVGTVFGMESKSQRDEAEKYCEGRACTDQRGVDAGDDARSAGDLATIGFAVAGVGLSAAAVLWFTAPSLGGHRESEPASARVGVGPGSILVRGAF